MPAVGLVKGSFVKTGVITGPGVPSVQVEGKAISVVGDSVSSHGATPHAKTTIATGSTSVYANGKNVTVATISKAYCGDQVDTGATSVFVGR